MAAVLMQGRDGRLALLAFTGAAQGVMRDVMVRVVGGDLDPQDQEVVDVRGSLTERERTRMRGGTRVRRKLLRTSSQLRASSQSEPTIMGRIPKRGGVLVGLVVAAVVAFANATSSAQLAAVDGLLLEADAHERGVQRARALGGELPRLGAGGPLGHFEFGSTVAQLPELVAQPRAAVRAGLVHQADLALAVAERDQVLAQQAQQRPETAAEQPDDAYSISETKIRRLHRAHLAFIRHVGPYGAVPDSLFDSLDNLQTFTSALATIDAPLEEMANPTKTPNPSKAPWYFLNLQELLLHMNPALAGVIVPTIALVLIAVIPYVDRSSRGLGVWWYNDRGPRIAGFTAIYTTAITGALIALDKFFPLKANFTNWLATADVAPSGQSGFLSFLTGITSDILGGANPEIAHANALGVLVEAIVGWIIPIICFIVFPILLVILLKLIFRGLDLSETILALFTGFVTVYFVLTFVGTAMRGIELLMTDTDSVAMGTDLPFDMATPEPGVSSR